MLKYWNKRGDNSYNNRRNFLSDLNLWSIRCCGYKTVFDRNIIFNVKSVEINI